MIEDYRIKIASPYIHKKTTVIWSNDFFELSYLGLYKGGNFLGLKLLIINRTDDDFLIKVDNMNIDGIFVDIFSYLNLDWHYQNMYIEHISINFDSYICDINSINKITFLNLYLLCEKDNEIVLKSPLITLNNLNYLEAILTDMNTLINKIQNGAVWDLSVNNHQGTIYYEFPYPSGKHGDIDMYLASQNGIVTQSSQGFYSITISSKKLDIIELMILFYYNEFSQNSLIARRNDDKKPLDFLLKYHNIVKLNHMYINAKRELDYKEIFDNITMQKSYNIIRDKYLELKNKRNDIYTYLVSVKKTSSKWISEQKLYIIIKDLFPDAIFQYQPKWLEQQSLDIFIPSLNIAIEYQGLQHYQPVNIFGGCQAFHTQKRRDSNKREKCRKNGIKLIEWKYDNELTLNNVKNLLLKS